MIAIRSPLDAYAEDVARVVGRDRLGERDGEWVMFAHAVNGLRASALGSGDGKVARVSELASRGEWRAVTDIVLAEADEMEEAGGFSLARSTLAATRALLPDESMLERGLLLAQEARIMRYLGDADSSSDLLDSVERLGRKGRLPELRVRADLGIGQLARRRGDYPSARVRFRRAIRMAQRARLVELLAGGHHLLCAAALVAADYDTALTHGWTAYSLVRGDAQREADVLVNLGAVCAESGYNAAALSCFLRAAERTLAWRVWAPALANAAIVAARMNDRKTLDWCATHVERTLASDDRPFERCAVILALAEARWLTGDNQRAEILFAEGRAIAAANGYHELSHDVEQLGKRMSEGRESPIIRESEVSLRARSALREIERLTPASSAAIDEHGSSAILS